MKKKIAIILLALISCFACALGLVACGGNEFKENLDSFTYTNENGVYEITGVKDSHITEAIIPDGVTSIARDAFRGCAELKTLVIPDSVTYIGFKAFVGCENIEAATLPASAISSLPKIKKLQTVTITSGEIGANAFKQCNKLTSVTIGNGVTSIGESAFYGCSGLTNITIPDSVTSIGQHAFTNSLMLIYCEAQSRPSEWDKMWTFGSNGRIIWNCNENDIANDGNIYEIVDGVIYALKDNVATVSEQANLSNQVILVNVINYKDKTYEVKSINDYAFRYCYTLTSITIPDSVTSIGHYVFERCSGLTEINYLGTKAQWDKFQRWSYWDYGTGDYVIHCTDGDINK